MPQTNTSFLRASAHNQSLAEMGDPAYYDEDETELDSADDDHDSWRDDEICRGDE